YAGPDPDSAVTASGWLSGSSMTLPTCDNIFSTIATWSGLAYLPGEATLIASPTSIGVFGMTRTTGTSPNRCSNSVVGRPAHSETINVRAVTNGARSANNGSMSCGLTATTRTSALLAASSRGTPRMPYCSASWAARSGWWSVSATSAGWVRPAWEPDSRGSPILPVPVTALTGLLMDTRSTGITSGS